MWGFKVYSVTVLGSRVVGLRGSGFGDLGI